MTVGLVSFKETASLTIYGNDWNRWTQIILLVLSFYVTRIKIIRKQSMFSMMLNRGYLDFSVLCFTILDFVETLVDDVTSQVVGFWWCGQFRRVLRGYGIHWQWWEVIIVAFSKKKIIFSFFILYEYRF